MRRLRSSKWGPTFEWDDLDEFIAAPHISDGVHRILAGLVASDHASLHVLVGLRPGTPLAVHFYGAKTKRRANDTPMFSALPTSQALSTSYVLVHDPTLDLTTEIGLGWYEGHMSFPAATYIRAVITHIMDIAEAQRAVLWGGSAGGYAALRHVGGIRDSVALVWNPQTAIHRYHRAPVHRYAQIAFNAEKLPTDRAIMEHFSFDLTQQRHPNWTDAPVVYLQEADDQHVRKHLAYLLTDGFPEASVEVTRRDSMFGLLSPNFYLHLSHWSPGHTRPPRSAITDFLTRLIDTATPVQEILAGLTTASEGLIKAARAPSRAPFTFELDAPIGQLQGRLRVLQWGSRFGQNALAAATPPMPLLVTRSVIGQSLITAYSHRPKPKPKTSLDLAVARDGEHRRTLLEDRRASAATYIADDPELDLVVLDLLEEVRGTVNAGNGLVLTDHGRLKRVDGAPVTHHAFGSDRHAILWSSRLSRFRTAIEHSNAQLVVLDIDAASLTAADWKWLGIPQPAQEELAQWKHLMKEARESLPGATWVRQDRAELPLASRSLDAGAQLSNTIHHLQDLAGDSHSNRRRCSKS